MGKDDHPAISHSQALFLVLSLNITRKISFHFNNTPLSWLVDKWLIKNPCLICRPYCTAFCYTAQLQEFLCFHFLSIVWDKSDHKGMFIDISFTLLVEINRKGKILFRLLTLCFLSSYFLKCVWGILLMFVKMYWKYCLTRLGQAHIILRLVSLSCLAFI